MSARLARPGARGAARRTARRTHKADPVGCYAGRGGEVVAERTSSTRLAHAAEAPDVTGCRGVSCSKRFPGQLAVVRVPPPPGGMGASARHHRARPPRRRTDSPLHHLFSVETPCPSWQPVGPAANAASSIRNQLANHLDPRPFEAGQPLGGHCLRLVPCPGIRLPRTCCFARAFVVRFGGVYQYASSLKYQPWSRPKQYRTEKLSLFALR
jgi:hypothetical protein